jgi:glutathione S-transferase
MRLLYSPTSPYARKVRIALLEKRAPCEHVIDHPLAPDSRVPLHNPLGKVPVLVLEHGDPLAPADRRDGRGDLYDSRAILQYLDLVFPEPPLFPREAAHRIDTLRYEALADGLCDAAVAIVLEKRRDERRQDPAVIAHQMKKVGRALDLANRWVADRVGSVGREAPLVDPAFGAADAAWLSALGYLDLRMPDAWRGHFAALEAYAAHFANRPSVAETTPPAA